jgi:hypothetical protein
VCVHERQDGRLKWSRIFCAVKHKRKNRRWKKSTITK